MTFGFLVTRRIDPALAIVYWISQMLGAVLRGAHARARRARQPHGPRQPRRPALGDGVGAGAGFAIEAILTFFLVWVIFASAADPRGTFKSIAGLAIGFTITLDILIGGPLTGAAMNPARAFGPQLVDGFWSDGWVWYLGPLLGGGAAALLYEWLYLRPAPPDPRRARPRPASKTPPAPGSPPRRRRGLLDQDLRENAPWLERGRRERSCAAQGLRGS